ncbi:MAG: HD domain-containing protein [Chloroflexi bacterium]|nr:HD domain-containing protein [Chloroflexota bacterium]
MTSEEFAAIIKEAEQAAQTTPVGLPVKAERVRVRVPARHNPKLQAVMAAVLADEELDALWHCQNVNAVPRLGMSDHGPVHVQIVANIALRILRILTAAGVKPSIVEHHGMSNDDAEVVVVLASLLHDVGMSIHRFNHEEYSLIIADRKLPALLDAAYADVGRRAVVQSETLHAIIAHRKNGKPLTLEAGVVRVADALDMAKGRSRIPFELGEVNIHSVSAMAIERVAIEVGEDKPVRVKITMSNSAGIFQVDSLLKEKLRGSGLEPYVEVFASIEGEHESSLVQRFVL